MTTLERSKAVPTEAVPLSEPPRVEGGIVAIEFPDVFRTHEAMLAAARLERRRSIVLDDAAVVSRDLNGTVRVNRGGRPTPMAAALWAATAAGVPAGWLLGPWAGLAAAVVAAAAAALWARSAVGLRPGLLRDIGAKLVPGRAAGCFLVSHAHPAHVLAEARRFEGKLIHSTLPESTNDELAEALASD